MNKYLYRAHLRIIDIIKNPIQNMLSRSAYETLFHCFLSRSFMLGPRYEVDPFGIKDRVKFLKAVKHAPITAMTAG